MHIQAKVKKANEATMKSVKVTEMGHVRRGDNAIRHEAR